MFIDYQKAKDKLLAGFDKDCQQFFVKNGCVLEDAYLHFLIGDLPYAKKQFALIKDSDIRAHWALFEISLIDGEVFEYPSYFELRNFLEIDLNLLITYCMGTFVEKIIRYADFMYTINPEVHKFIGRVLYNNNLPEQGMFFLNRAKNYFYHDPELHYLLAYINYQNNDYSKCRKSLEDCLRILPDYFPAKDMKKKLESYNA